MHQTAKPNSSAKDWEPSKFTEKILGGGGHIDSQVNKISASQETLMQEQHRQVCMSENAHFNDLSSEIDLFQKHLMANNASLHYGSPFKDDRNPNLIRNSNASSIPPLNLNNEQLGTFAVNRMNK